MARFSSFKVGGPAEAMIAAANPEELQGLIQWLDRNGIDWRIVGRGSNILVPDRGLAGVTIILEGDFSTHDQPAAPPPETGENEVLIRAGGGCLLPGLVQYCTSMGLSGLEFAAGIPGSVGGAIVMNAGAWGSEVGEKVHEATLMDSRGKIFSAPGDHLGFGYRQWSMPPKTVLLSAVFRLIPGSKDEIRETCRKYLQLRRENQPLAEPSAGSFFKNPPAESAGRLIEAAGLKGAAVGGAKISEKHANFIVNTGGARAVDILTLMHLVQKRVYNRFGVKLEPEVHILGEE